MRVSDRRFTSLEVPAINVLRVRAGLTHINASISLGQYEQEFAREGST